MSAVPLFSTSKADMSVGGAETKPARRRHRLFQIVGGIAFSLLIVAGLIIAETFNR